MSANSIDQLLLATKPGAFALAAQHATRPTYAKRRGANSKKTGRWQANAADLIARSAAFALSLSIIVLTLSVLTMQ